MSRILSIGTAVPHHRHKQSDILNFMQTVFSPDENGRRKMRYLYAHSGIEERYSVLADYSRPVQEWKFYPNGEGLEPFPSLEQRMVVYNRQAPQLSIEAIRDCLGHRYSSTQITHLITVSCTGMSAPGLDLQLADLMELGKNTWRTSVNFMGCYAAIHALKIADVICRSDRSAKVLIVCTELCTLHFQKEASIDNIMSSMLFGDGAAAALVGSDDCGEGLQIVNFYSEIIPKGKRDMAWELSSTGFLMTLSSYVPELIAEDFGQLVRNALQEGGITQQEVSHWCIHPGGKRILEAVQKSMDFSDGELQEAYQVLKDFGNLSSATILFVLKKLMHQKRSVKNLFAAAFGPGLTIETFTAH